tara:strand:+ start:859 stop:1446 length:588 start_codon:yes stop_codon:yes gene_type:complete
MVNKRKVYIFFSILVLLIIFFSYYLNIDKKSSKQIEQIQQITNEDEKEVYTSNIIENVSYKANDTRGNEYTINALTGEIDIKNNDVIFLKDVKAVIKLENSEYIKITSQFGKYNIKNNDTIFSKNVLIKYLDNKINSEYLDFSIIRDKMIVSKNVTYTKANSVMKADVIEMNLSSKNIKIFMHLNDEKVNINNIY